MTTATRLDTVMDTWAPTTFHYAISDGTYVAVEVDDSGPTEAMQAYVEQVNTLEVTPMPMTYTPRPTVIIAATEDGRAVNLTRLHEFPPGTSHDDALIRAGFEVTE